MFTAKLVFECIYNITAYIDESFDDNRSNEHSLSCLSAKFITTLVIPQSSEAYLRTMFLNIYEAYATQLIHTFCGLFVVFEQFSL